MSVSVGARMKIHYLCILYVRVAQGFRIERFQAEADQEAIAEATRILRVTPLVSGFELLQEGRLIKRFYDFSLHRAAYLRTDSEKAECRGRGGRIS